MEATRAVPRTRKYRRAARLGCNGVRRPLSNQGILLCPRARARAVPRGVVDAVEQLVTDERGSGEGQRLVVFFLCGFTIGQAAQRPPPKKKKDLTLAGSARTRPVHAPTAGATATPQRAL
jgi:hypothetical protein